VQLKVVKNKDIAFSGFVRNVIHYGMYNWIRKWQRGPIRRVPLKIAKKASKIFNFYLTYEENPIKDLVQWSNEAILSLKQLEKIHDEEWKRYKEKIDIFLKTMKKLVKKYGKFIINTIPKRTKIPWKYKEVWIIPSIYFGATTEDNKIFRGVVKPIKELKDVEAGIPGLVHELIHVNEQPKYLSRLNKEELLEYLINEYKKFKFPNASREIATMVLTNIILEDIEKKFGLKLKKQKSHPHYKYVISAIRKDLEKSPKEGFEEIRSYVDFLISKKCEKKIFARRHYLNLFLNKYYL
jgi:hypothetical protein